LVWIFGQKDGMLFAVYEGEGTKHQQWGQANLGPSYGIIGEMAPVMLECQGDTPNTMISFYQGNQDNNSGITFTDSLLSGNSLLKVTATTTTGYDNNAVSGTATLIYMGDSVLNAVGTKMNMRISAPNIGVAWAYNGNFQKGKWVRGNAKTLTSGNGYVEINFNTGNAMFDQIQFKLTGVPFPKPDSPITVVRQSGSGGAVYTPGFAATPSTPSFLYDLQGRTIGGSEKPGLRLGMYFSNAGNRRIVVVNRVSGL
jgi:hypothetical protein